MPPKRAKTATTQASATSAPASAPVSKITRTRAQNAVAANERPENDKDAITPVRKLRSKEAATRRVQSKSAKDTAPNARSSPVAVEKSEFDFPMASSEEEQAVTVKQPVAQTARRRAPRTVKKSAQTEAQKAAIEGLKQRMARDLEANAEGVQPSAQKDDQAVKAAVTVKKLGRQSVASTGRRFPSPPRRVVPGTATRPPQSALKMQSTPGAETSILALANFRRRPRQPSLLQMVQQGEIGQDTTDLSLPDFDDFDPEDESTPLQVVKSKALVAIRTDNSDDELYEVSPRPSPNTRKRKSDEMESPSEIEVIRSSPLRSESPLSESNAGVEQDPTSELPVPATAPEAVEGDDMQSTQLSDTLADPLSSSPPPFPQQGTGQAGQRVGPRGRGTVHLSHPTDQEHTSRQARTKIVTTASLRAFLPKRRSPRIRSARREPRSDFDIPTSSDTGLGDANADMDEYENVPKSRSRNARASVLQHPTTASKKTQAQHKTRTRGSAAPITTSNSKRTYGRPQLSSDKENDRDASSELTELVSDDEDVTGDTSLETVAPKKDKGRGHGPATQSSELAKAREKFKVVDEWEMEFESASLGAGGSSSPWR